MTLLLILLLISSVLSALPPTRSVAFMEANIDGYGVCRLSLLMPFRRVRVYGVKKPQLPIGDEEPPLIEKYIESIPAEARIQILGGFMKCTFCRELTVVVDESPSEQMRVYSEFVLSSMYLEAGVLRLLYRFALNALRPEETHIKTATSLLIFIRNYFEKMYNQSLDYLTPRLLKEWYDLIGDPSKFHLCAKHRFIREEQIPDNAIIRLNFRQWQYNIVRSRISNIRKFGYETFTH